MKIGDLVKYHYDGDIGWVTVVHETDGSVWIEWADGCNGWHLESEMEVING